MAWRRAFAYHGDIMRAMVRSLGCCCRAIGRSWRWLFVLVVMIALGVGLYELLPPAPRWSVPGRYWIQGFTPDNAAVVTCTRVENSDEDRPALRKFSWWDVQTGKELCSIETVCSYHAFSPDYRYVAAGAGTEFWILDRQSGRKVSVAGTWAFDRWPSMHWNLSPSVEVLVRHFRGVLHQIDVATGAVRRQDEVDSVYGFLPGSTRLVCTRQQPKQGSHVDVWDADTGKLIRSYGPYQSLQWCSGGRRYCVASKQVGKDCCVEVIDLAEDREPWHAEKSADTPRRIVISDDDRLMAVWHSNTRNEEWDIGFWDMVEQRRLAGGRMPRGCNYGIFSPDRAKFVAIHDTLGDIGSSKIKMPPHPIAVLDVATGRKFWQKQLLGGISALVGFTSNGKSLCVDTHSALEFFDLGSGVCSPPLKRFVDAGPQFTVEANTFSGLNQTKDRRYHLQVRYRAKKTMRLPWLNWKLGECVADEIAIVNLDEEHVVGRLGLDECESFGFCERGPLLITSHRDGDEWHLAAWDVPPGKSWLMILGIPAGLAVGLVVLKIAYRRLHGRRAKLS